MLWGKKLAKNLKGFFSNLRIFFENKAKLHILWYSNVLSKMRENADISAVRYTNLNGIVW